MSATSMKPHRWMIFQMICSHVSALLALIVKLKLLLCAPVEFHENIEPLFHNFSFTQRSNVKTVLLSFIS